MARRRTSDDLGRLSDEDLLALVREGDSAAFEVMYDRHSRVAFSLAFRLVGDRSAAEDLVQDAFLAVWRGSRGYAPGLGSVRNWVLSIVHHRGVDRLRTASAMNRRQEALEQVARVDPVAPDAADEAADRVLAGTVRAELGELPNDQQRVLRLAYFGGFTHHEIAEMLDLPLGTVKSRMRLGLDRLRRGLAGPEFLAS